MAGLSALNLPTRTIPTSGGDIAVRGLSLSDFSALLNDFAGQMAEAFELIQTAASKKGGSLAQEDTLVILRDVSSTAPVLIGAVIAFASDEPTEIETACRLPFLDQVRLLEAIFYLTFTSEEDVKNLVEIVVKALTGVNTLRVVDVRAG